MCLLATLGICVRTSTGRKKFRPGDLAPITGVYVVNHGVRHRDRHEVVIIRGEQLPTCRTCKLNVFFEILRPISHITHDWDFSGPSTLVISPARPDSQDFRIFGRAHLQLPVKVRLRGSTSAEVIHGYTSDLSAGGVGTVIRTTLPSRYLTETVTLSIERGRDSLSVPARLRYHNGLRHGFEFVNVGAAEREIIRRIITRHRARAKVATQ